jgi:hypothetical protein
MSPMVKVIKLEKKVSTNEEKGELVCGTKYGQNFSVDLEENVGRGPLFLFG